MIVTTSDDTGSRVAGALSGKRIDFTTTTPGAGGIRQRITVAPGAMLNFSFYAKKETQGVVTISLTNDIDNFPFTFTDNTQYDWARHTIQDIIPTSNYLDITVYIDADVDLFSITDMMIAKGAVPKPWEQAGGEVANTNVQFDTTGITVKSNVYDDARTVMTPLEFAGYKGSTRAFSVNGDRTEVNKLSIVLAANDVRDDGGDIQTPTHDIYFLTSGPNAGMNFVVRGL